MYEPIDDTLGLCGTCGAYWRCEHRPSTPAKNAAPAAPRLPTPAQRVARQAQPLTEEVRQQIEQRRGVSALRQLSMCRCAHDGLGDRSIVHDLDCVWYDRITVPVRAALTENHHQYIDTAFIRGTRGGPASPPFGRTIGFSGGWSIP